MGLGMTALVTADAFDMHDAGAGWWFLMMLGMVLFWALVIAGVVWLVRGGLGSSANTPSRPAHEVLDERLASGEISVEEYEQRRAALRGSNQSRS